MAIKKVVKFGGSSVANPERIRDAVSIVLQAAKKERVVVVVSAFQGVTNQLIESARLAETGDTKYQTMYNTLAKRHLGTLKQLHHNRPPAHVTENVQAMLTELSNVLQGIYLLRHSSPRALDLTASFGERLSALIISSFIQQSQPSCFVDSRELVMTDDQFTRAVVQFDKTNPAIRKYFKKLFEHSSRRLIPVVTGFIGSTDDGLTTTIGRNGSDYSAAIFGAALGVSLIEIWTDVDGILSADPRAVPSAFVVPTMSYEEAMELSYFGAKVLHASTIAPAVAKHIPIDIKNTLNPSAAGTHISHHISRWEGVAKGITSVDDCTLLTLRGMSMVGVPGIAERLFRALASHRVNVILISQASSEHTICFAISSMDAPAAKKAVHHEFHYELQSRLTSLDEKTQQTIVAIVGDGMKGTPGVSGKVFQALGRNSVNISAIAQGASERNISFVIDEEQKLRALNVIHEAFFEPRKKLGVVLIGPGNIGGTFLKQIHQQQSYLRSAGYDVRVCGIYDIGKAVFASKGIDLKRWRELLEIAPKKMKYPELLKQIAALQLTNAVLVDCTASPEIVNMYEDFVKLNMHIITPNKRANVLPWHRYTQLTELLKNRQKYFLYETNVGAGLPIISTLQDLIASGDQIVKIEGMFSGTLSHLFNYYNGTRPFSVLVQEALGLGYTEPDPREDLSGGDVARKLLILARQIGLKMDMEDIGIENLVPKQLRQGAFTKEFFQKYAKVDDLMLRRLEKAKAKGSVLRYVGVLQGGKASAGIKEVPANHMLASTKGSDNIIAFTTQRYSKTPLVVQGPGAGADVTAMGVFSDLLKLLHYLPQ
ncbi:MAG: bifunctional aspartate kinase/homoserine dehydrogenase I [Ignavibacteriae bacterium]|nr:MAG: bifunctional aspartate kinase/homoserine dehydrogenase I [Ignavibacteriota bacterium]